MEWLFHLTVRYLSQILEQMYWRSWIAKETLAPFMTELMANP